MTLYRSGDLGMSIQCAVMVEGVPAVQHPSIPCVDGDACVSAGVAGQRHQHDSRCDLVEFLGGGESPPFLPVGVVLDDLGPVRPLAGAKAHLLLERRFTHSALYFGAGGVDLCVGKVGDAADVVHVEMRDDDVADIGAGEAEALHLAQRRLAVVEHRLEEVARGPDAGVVVAVVRPVSGVDENQAVVGLDEQYVTDDSRCYVRVHRPAVQMVDLHSSPDPARASSSPRPICVTRLAESK